MLADKKKWEGTFVALATPFSGGKLDEEAYARLCEEVLDQGCEGLVPCGTTGETPTLSVEEQERCVRIAVEAARKKGATVIAGAGSNSTAATIEAVRRGEGRGRGRGPGGHALLQQAHPGRHRGPLPRHRRGGAGLSHRRLRGAGANRRRTSSPILTPALAEIKEVVAVKEADGEHAARDRHPRAGRRSLRRSSRATTSPSLPFIACGGRGVISVSANVAPRLIADLVRAALAGRTRAGPGAASAAERPAPRPLPRIQPHPGEGGAPPDGAFR